MKDRKLATRYARALLSSLTNDRDAESAEQFLTALRGALNESTEFRELMLDPAVANSVRGSLLGSLAKQNGMSSQVVNFLATIVDHGRASSLASIAEVFHEERERQMGIVEAQVTTASPLSEELKRQTLETLERVTGRKVRLTAELDPEILGGAVTRVGSEVYDGSLRNQLSQLRRKMTEE